jgi:hypothetical protein
MTNGDRIRQMSDEELYDDVLYMIDCAQCDFWRKCDDLAEDRSKRRKVCRKIWMDWLSEEAED